MKKILCTLFTFSLLFFSCNKAQPPKTCKPKVLVSVAPYTYFVEKIAGDLVEVATLAPEGINPHIFEPSPKQIQDVYQSSLWLRIGEDFERKIAKSVDNLHSHLKVNNLSTKIPLHHGQCTCHHHHHEIDQESKDLHIWMSPKLAKIQAQSIESSLEELIPEHKDALQANLTLFIEELEKLDEHISKTLSPLSGSAILVSHPAFDYFCKDYNLKQISIEVEGKDPRPKDLANILEEAKNSSVKLVLIQQQYNNKGAITIAEKLNLPTYLIDPYSKEYTKMLTDIAEMIAKNHE